MSSTPGFGDSNLLRLPDELLHEVIILAIDIENTNFNDDKCYKTPWSLTLVCRRISRMAYPLLYHTISFQPHSSRNLLPVSNAAKLLLRSLCANAALAPLCMKVRAHIDYKLGLPSSDFDEASKFLCKFPNVQSFEFHGGFYDPNRMWSLLSQTFGSLPCITGLTITASIGTVELSTILKVDLPAFRRLKVYATPPRAHLLSSRPSIMYEAVQGKKRTCSITDLSIHGYASISPTFSALLAWPIALEHFSFRPSAVSPGAKWALTHMQHILDPHCLTLKSLELWIQEPTNSHLDLTKYSVLEDLYISAYAHMEHLGEHAPHLASPSLRRFTWDFHFYDCNREAVDVFGKPQADGLRDFINYALAQGCPLQGVHIVFSPYASVYSGARSINVGPPSSQRYPWDWMDELASEFAPQGVQLTYTEPRSVTREEYEEAMKNGKPTESQEAIVDDFFVY